MVTIPSVCRYYTDTMFKKTAKSPSPVRKWGFFGFCVDLLHTADEISVFLVDGEGAAGVEIALEDRPGDESLGLALEIALHGSGAIDRVETVVDDVLLCRIGELQPQLPIRQTAPEARDQVVDDAAQVLLGQGLKEDGGVQTACVVCWIGIHFFDVN